MHVTYRHDRVHLADETLNRILDVIAEGTWDWEAATGHVTRSPGWYRMLGYEVGCLDETVFTWEDVIHPDDYARVMDHFEQYIRGAISSYKIEYRCKKADGSYLWIIDQGKIVAHNEDGSVARMIGAHQCIHEQKTAQETLLKQNRMLIDGKQTLEKNVEQKTRELEQKNRELEQKIKQIEHISKTDVLTGVANRKNFEEILSKEKARSRRYNHPLSISLFDIDHFKQINDRYGHNTGDEVLKSVAHLIQDNIRQMDVLARWGGDEFIIIYPDLALPEALSATEKLRSLVEKKQLIDGISVSCSFGLSQYRSDDQGNSLFQRVDRALYNAKQLGRNRIESLA